MLRDSSVRLRNPPIAVKKYQQPWTPTISCFKCFDICFQVFHLDVVNVAMAIYACCKRMFHVTSKCFRCFKRMFQVFHLDVVEVD